MEMNIMSVPPVHVTSNKLPCYLSKLPWHSCAVVCYMATSSNWTPIGTHWLMPRPVVHANCGYIVATMHFYNIYWII